MALPPGTRLGAYEVTAQIGAGGMGEVYRATDSSLKRSVAIKVLPASMASDADRLARFQREAEVLAALNHPNIAAIYGLEKTSDLTALVMELVEGEDLSERIARGAMPIDEALAIAKQIAEALEAAHEQGIIHRDLKPANVKVRPDGTVKVLDFGLAKAMDRLEGDGFSRRQSGTAAAEAAALQTITSPAMTMQGMILGTAAYMSPEQAKGKAVDKRADIWAFGVVLYEMLSGRRAFAGEDVSDLLVAVLSKDVDLAALPAGTPSSIRALIRRCLTRDPKRRLRDIGDARLVLEDPAAIEPGALPTTSRTRTRERMASAAAAIFALLAVGAGTWALRPIPTPPETRVDIVTPATAQPASFALSPDGRQIVFVASDDKVSRLWLRSLSTSAAQPLAGTEGATYPFWSPDGKAVGFFAEGSLKRLDLGGGAPRALSAALNGNGGTWNADGVIVFAPSASSPLMRVPADGGVATAATTLGTSQSAHTHPQFLPDGRRFLFMVGGAGTGGFYLGGLDGSSPARLTSDVALTSPAYVSPGWLLWVRAGALLAQRLDLERPVLAGEPVTLADDVASSDGTGRSAVSVAATGLVAYRASGSDLRQLTWFDRSGTASGVVGVPDNAWFQPRLSPDGRRVAVARTTKGNQDLWLLEGDRASRFTFDPGQEFFAVWSPDSSRIVYAQFRTGAEGVFEKLTSGAGVAEQVLATDTISAPTSWSADGRFLLYNNLDPKSNGDLWVLPMSGASRDRKSFVFLNSPFREAYGAFSPDGRWVAYHSHESGRPEIYVRPFALPGATRPASGQWQVSTAGGIMPTWRHDGKELYYINADGAMMAAPITVTGSSLEPGAPVLLFPTRILGGGADTQLGRQYDVSADGRFLINTLLNDAATPITLLQNWRPPSK